MFARAKAYELSSAAGKNSVIIDKAEVQEFVVDKKPFRYDLYKIPFNDGNGGVAEPLAGASDNGMSNFFAQYSPGRKVDRLLQGQELHAVAGPTASSTS